MNTKQTLKILTFIVVLTLTFTLVSAQTLTWDESKHNITSTYDARGRILTNSDISYTYDVERNDSLTNITNAETSIKYEYDNKGRIMKEIKTIDGLTFTKDYSYDSMDRIISINGLDYVYGEDSNVKSVDEILNSTYNENSQIKKREYANSLDSEFMYGENNFRLNQIKTGSFQELNYTYDNVSNVVKINDIVNSRIFSIVYDDVKRLLSVNIDDGVPIILNYTFSSIGNLMSVLNNGNMEVYSYEDKVHAPSLFVKENDMAINIINPGNNSTLTGNVVKISWLTYGNFLRNLMTYTIQYSNDGGSTWTVLISNLGFTNKFNDSTTEKVFEMTEEETETVYIRLPKDSRVSKAQIKIRGLTE